MHKNIYVYIPSSISRLKIFCILPLGVVSKNFRGDVIIFLKTLLCTVVEARIVAYVIIKPRMRLVIIIKPIHVA